jgi:predicted nucleotidyltransferase
MPLTRRIITERIEALRPELRQLGVSRVALFGSYLRDAATPHSDIDLLIDFKPGCKTFRSLVSLAEMLEGALQCRVDAVTVESLSPHIGPRILAEAVDVLRAA